MPPVSTEGPTAVWAWQQRPLLHLESLDFPKHLVPENVRLQFLRRILHKTPTILQRSGPPSPSEPVSARSLHKGTGEKDSALSKKKEPCSGKRPPTRSLQVRRSPPGNERCRNDGSALEP